MDPPPAVAVLSGNLGHLEGSRIREGGIRAYSKPVGPGEFEALIRDLLEGTSLKRFVASFARSHGLNERETLVVQLAAKGIFGSQAPDWGFVGGERQLARVWAGICRKVGAYRQKEVVAMLTRFCVGMRPALSSTHGENGSSGQSSSSLS